MTLEETMQKIRPGGWQLPWRLQSSTGTDLENH